MAGKILVEEALVLVFLEALVPIEMASSINLRRAILLPAAFAESPGWKEGSLDSSVSSVSSVDSDTRGPRCRETWIMLSLSVLIGDLSQRPNLPDSKTVDPKAE